MTSLEPTLEQMALDSAGGAAVEHEKSETHQRNVKTEYAIAN